MINDLIFSFGHFVSDFLVTAVYSARDDASSRLQEGKIIPYILASAIARINGHLQILALYRRECTDSRPRVGENRLRENTTII